MFMGFPHVRYLWFNTIICRCIVMVLFTILKKYWLPIRSWYNHIDSYGGKRRGARGLDHVIHVYLNIVTAYGSKRNCTKQLYSSLKLNLRSQGTIQVSTRIVVIASVSIEVLLDCSYFTTMLRWKVKWKAKFHKDVQILVLEVRIEVAAIRVEWILY